MRRTVRETLDVSAAPTCFSKVVAIVVIVIYFPADISLFLVSNNTLYTRCFFFYFLQKFPIGKNSYFLFLALLSETNFWLYLDETFVMW